MVNSAAAALMAAYLIFATARGDLGRLMEILGLSPNANRANSPGLDIPDFGGSGNAP